MKIEALGSSIAQVIIGTICVCTNGMLVFAIRRNKSLWNSKAYVLPYAVAAVDLTQSVSFIYGGTYRLFIVLSNSTDNVKPISYCFYSPLMQFMVFFLYFYSTLNLFVAVERFVATRFFAFHMKFDRRDICRGVLSILTFSIAALILTSAISYLYITDDSISPVCHYIEMSPLPVFFAIGHYCGFLLLSVVFTLLVLLNLRSFTYQATDSTIQAQRRARQISVTHTMIPVVLATVLFGILPYAAAFGLNFYHEQLNWKEEEVIYIGNWLALGPTANSLSNIFIYLKKNNEIRYTVVSILHGRNPNKFVKKRKTRGPHIILRNA